MCGGKIPNTKIFGSDKGWETLLERSYNFDLFSCKDDERAAEEEGKELIEEMLNTNTFLLSQTEERRDDFYILAQACNKLAARQNGEFDVRLHSKENMMCVRIYSPVFMLVQRDISLLHNMALSATYMEIEAINDAQMRSRITLGLSFSNQSKNLMDDLQTASFKAAKTEK